MAIWSRIKPMMTVIMDSDTWPREGDPVIQIWECEITGCPRNHQLPKTDWFLVFIKKKRVHLTLLERTRQASLRPPSILPSSSSHLHIFTSSHLHIHTGMYVYTHTHKYAYTHTHKYAYVHTCIHAYMHTCIRAYIHTCIRAYMYENKQTHSFMYAHSCDIASNRTRILILFPP